MNTTTRVLTDEDVAAIASALSKHSDCHLGLTPEEVTILKQLLSAFQKAAGIVGSAILTALVAALIAVFTKGFWITLFDGIKGK